MRPRKSTVQLKQFHVNEKQRQLNLVKTMLSELEHSKLELQNAVEIEEKRSGVSDPSKMTYSSLAKSLRDRMANIEQSIADLTFKVEAAEEALEEVQLEYTRAVDLEVRESSLMRA